MNKNSKTNITVFKELRPHYDINYAQIYIDVVSSILQEYADLYEYFYMCVIRFCNFIISIFDSSIIARILYLDLIVLI